MTVEVSHMYMRKSCWVRILLRGRDPTKLPMQINSFVYLPGVSLDGLCKSPEDSRLYRSFTKIIAMLKLESIDMLGFFFILEAIECFYLGGMELAQRVYASFLQEADVIFPKSHLSITSNIIRIRGVLISYSYPLANGLELPWEGAGYWIGCRYTWHVTGKYEGRYTA